MKYDFLIYKSSSVKKELSIDGDYLDYTVKMQIKKHPSNENFLLEKIPIIENGNIVIELTPEDTSVEWSNAVYDIKITSPEGEVSFPYYGSIRIKPNITN